MSEEEILQGIDDLKHAGCLTDYGNKIINGILDLYNKEKETSHFIQSQLDITNAKLIGEKEKYNLVIKENLDDKYEEALEKTFKKYIDKDFISKDKIREILKKYEITEIIADYVNIIKFYKEIEKLLEE